MCHVWCLLHWRCLSFEIWRNIWYYIKLFHTESLTIYILQLIKLKMADADALLSECWQQALHSIWSFKNIHTRFDFGAMIFSTVLPEKKNRWYYFIKFRKRPRFGIHELQNRVTQNDVKLWVTDSIESFNRNYSFELLTRLRKTLNFTLSY